MESVRHRTRPGSPSRRQLTAGVPPLHRKPSFSSLPDAARIAEAKSRLQTKLPNRPTKEALQAQNILKGAARPHHMPRHIGTGNAVSPTVYAKQEALAKAKLAESLQERILVRRVAFVRSARPPHRHVPALWTSCGPT